MFINYSICIASDFWQAHGDQGEKNKDRKSKSGSTPIKTLH